MTKHLSTHVYFHMDRGQAQRKPGGPAPSGFGPLVPPECSPPSSQTARSRASGGSKDSTGSGAALVVTGFERLSRTLRAGLDPFQDPDRFEPTEDTAFLCDNPYVMSPDFVSARENRTSNRKRLWRKSRPETKYEAKELQSYGVYGHRFEPSGRTSGRTTDFRSGNGAKYAPVPSNSRTGYGYEDDYREFFPEHGSSSSGGGEAHSSVGSVGGRLEERDCFVIPAHKVERFLPVQRIPESTAAAALGLVEIRDPHLCLVIDFGENATYGAQDLPSPTGGPLALAPKEWTASQLGRQRKLFAWVRESRGSSQGMLLMNVERHCQFPFVTYLVVSGGPAVGDPRRLIAQLQNQVSSGQTHEEHHIAGYEEVASIIRPPVETMHAKIATSYKTGYIISAFRVFPGEDREKLERSWLTWTGARQIYKRLPKQLGLRRIAFHKKVYPERGITYVLVCECTALMDYVTEACSFVDQLRARCCGYTALYRVADMF